MLMCDDGRALWRVPAASKQMLLCFLTAYEVVVWEYLFQTWFKRTWLTRSHHLCKKWAVFSHAACPAGCFSHNFPFHYLFYSEIELCLGSTVTSIYPGACLYMYVLSLFISVGKSRQWDPWLQRPSCNSKSQSHLWHWTAWSYYLWAPIHHLLGWQRRKTRECGRGKYTDRMHPSACTPNLCMYSCGLSFSSNLTKERRCILCDLALTHSVSHSATLSGENVSHCLTTR